MAGPTFKSAQELRLAYVDYCSSGDVIPINDLWTAMEADALDELTSGTYVIPKTWEVDEDTFEVNFDFLERYMAYQGLQYSFVSEDTDNKTYYVSWA